MAFGFGFNKQKVLSAAEKYVQQGKMQNAIAEYEKVLKADPKDLTVTNTVGDLYSRLGEADKATECFKTVGDAYANQGFTVKAIAMYKKISKLKPSLESVLKLAELYTQQGLFNDARAQYLQVAEEFLKSGELENAVRIFQKILEMDPENTTMRIRLAEVYIRLSKKNEAWQIFSAAAETLHSKGSLSAAQEVLQRMLALDPGNGYVMLMQGRNLLESGDVDAAIQSLQKVPDLDSNPDGLRDLLKAYLKTGRLSDAGTLATKLLAVHNDLAAIANFADALMQAGQYENALQVYGQHADRLLAEDSERILKNLHSIIGHVRDNPASLEKLLDLFQKAGDSTHSSEVIELLAHASVQSGDLPRARDLYQKLATVEPGNPLHMNNYQQVVSQLGGPAAAKLISAEEAAVIVDELEATAPSIHQHYPDAVALAVRSALTDAELFISYNMPAKALGPLMAALPQAPTDLRLNQRLAALHTRANRFAEAAVCCRTLQNVYSEAEYPEEATRYGELADRYEERSALPAVASHAIEQAAAESAVSDETPSAAAPWPAPAPEPGADLEFTMVSDQDDLPVAATAEASAAAPEIDLSSEWDDAITIEADTTIAETVGFELPNAADDLSVAAGVTDEIKCQETVEEIRFYLEHGMPEQAAAALAKLHTITTDENLLATLRAEVEVASQAPSASEELPAVEALSEFSIDDFSTVATVQAAEIPTAAAEPTEAVALISAMLPHALEVPAHAAEVEAAVSAPANLGLQGFVAELESSLGGGFLPGEAPEQGAQAAVAAFQAQPDAEPEQIDAVASALPITFDAPAAGVIGEFVADLEASLGDDFLKNAPGATPTVARKAVAAAKSKIPAEAGATASTPHPQSVPAPPVHAPLAAAAAASSGSGAVSSHYQVPAPQQAAAAPAFHATVHPPIPSTLLAKPLSSGSEDAGIDLAEMFGELKHDLESGASADEDPETHYNLGIAFREMGLLDEAIGELQKTCQAVDHGHPFKQVMQTYTWLAQCFLDKGVPEAAIRWYNKALHTQGIDEETRTALYYELGMACESAGDKASALKHFMEVYGRNIDYRDVAERVKPLKS